MKAIYINIDRYLQAVADWLNAGHPGDAPKFSPLPVAVTIPAGQTACIYCPSAGEAETDPINAPNSVTIDGKTLYFAQTADDGIPVDAIAVKVAPGLSALAPSAKYWVEGVTGNTSATFYVTDGDVLGDAPIYFTIPVLVQFEKSSGVVDLVDFTPPLSGQCLDGAWFNDGELKVLKSEETALSRVMLTAASGIAGTDVLTASTPGS